MHAILGYYGVATGTAVHSFEDNPVCSEQYTTQFNITEASRWFCRPVQLKWRTKNGEDKAPTLRHGSMMNRLKHPNLN